MSAGADIASATTVDLTAATGNTVVITGTTATSALTMNTGQQMWLLPSGAWPLTYNATTMNINNGTASYTCAAGDRVFAVKDLAGVIRITVIKKDGTGVSNIQLQTAQATTSGTSIDWNTIPAGVKRVTLTLSAVSTNGTSDLQVRLGSGSIDTSGYSGTATNTSTSTAMSAGFLLTYGVAAANSYHSVVNLDLINPSNNTWAMTSSTFGTTASTALSGGSKAFSGSIDRIRLTTVNGTDTFDAGVANVSWEF